MVEATAATYRDQLSAERERVREQLRHLGHDGDRAGFDENFADSGQVTAERGEVEALVASLLDALEDVDRALGKLDSDGLRALRVVRHRRSPRRGSRRCRPPACASAARRSAGSGRSMVGRAGHLAGRFFSSLLPLPVSAADREWVASVLRPEELDLWSHAFARRSPRIDRRRPSHRARARRHGARGRHALARGRAPARRREARRPVRAGPARGGDGGGGSARTTSRRELGRQVGFRAPVRALRLPRPARCRPGQDRRRPGRKRRSGPRRTTARPSGTRRASRRSWSWRSATADGERTAGFLLSAP